MTECGQSGTAAAELPGEAGPGMQIRRLRARGAEHFDPVGWRFIDALARRAAAHRGGVRRVLERRLDEALHRYAERFDHAADEAKETLARGRAQFPHASDVLQQCHDDGDFRGLSRQLAAMGAEAGRGPLAELLGCMGGNSNTAGMSPVSLEGAQLVVAQGELKSLSYFRDTWSRLSVEQTLSHALAQAPENAGPLNSHFLVLQALGVMRDIAPEYLARFMSFADALLWLEQADSSRHPVQKSARRGDREIRRKGMRGRSG